MAEVAWIRVIDDNEATGRVKEVYEQARASRGINFNMARAASLWPELLELQEREFKLFTGSETELGDDIKDLIAARVSQLNNNDYCSHWFRSALESRNWSDEKITHILQDIRSDHLNKKDQAILVFADKITRLPQSMNSEDIDALRLAGVTDRAILETAAITGYFNYITRLAGALGVMREEEPPAAANF